MSMFGSNPQTALRTMQRRSFLASAAAACVSPRLFGLAQEQDASIGPLKEPNREELRTLLGTLLVSESPELREFGVDVYAKCVLG